MMIKFKSGSPDGMSVKYVGYLMTWEDAKDFITWISLFESGQYRKILKTIGEEQPTP
jgi:hypothetical protein